jgi:thioredoxin 1
MKLLTDPNFKKETESGVIIIDLFADWCGPCRALTPILEELEPKFEGVTFAKLNVDDSPATSEEYGVMSIPCVLILKDGKEVKRIVGLYPKSAYVDALTQVSAA